MQVNMALINNPTHAHQIKEHILTGQWGMPIHFASAAVFRATDYMCREMLMSDGGWMSPVCFQFLFCHRLATDWLPLHLFHAG